MKKNLETTIRVSKDGKSIEAVNDINDIVGYILFDFPDDSSDERNLEIEYIYVKPKYRCRGIASKMLQHLIVSFPYVLWFSLWTGKEIEKSKGNRLYAKNGFTRLAYQEDYYEDGVGTSLFGFKNQ